MGHQPPKMKRSVFVIMPFTETPLRDRDDLSEFFKTNLKERIESETSLKYQYIVRRSDDTFDITAQIVRDIYSADVVLCDLSGPSANPNVMYELGMRLAISNKPVILFREANSQNRPIFDIAGFYAYEYRPQQYRPLEDYIITKLRRYESGEELYESPVLKVLRTEPSVITEVNRKRVYRLLDSFHSQVQGMQRVLSGALHVFLTTYNIQHTFQDIDETLQFFQDNAEMLLRLPWHTFAFIPHPMPSIHAFLVDLPLADLLSDDSRLRVNTYVSEYYNFFLASEYTWQHPDFSTVFYFLGESWLLRQVLAGCMLLVRQGTELEEKQIYAAMDKYLAQSNIWAVKKSSAESAEPRKATKRSSKRVPPKGRTPTKGKRTRAKVGRAGG